MEQKVAGMKTSPTSDSYVSLPLAEIQERFIELMQQELTDLRLEDCETTDFGGDPYNKFK